MYYIFIGKNFFFTKFCNDLDLVTATIQRNTKPYKSRDQHISKKIRRVTDEIGTVIYESDK